ncbi:hypothetical protein ACFW04_002491 [Cataglyphis niger]
MRKETQASKLASNCLDRSAENYGTCRRSAQPPITRCQRRQAVIRRLNSRSSRSVFVRVNLHQVSIFRLHFGARRRRTAASPRRRAKSTVTPAALINNTSKNNGENIGVRRGG